MTSDVRSVAAAPHRTTREAGYTFIEIMAVLLAMGIVCAMIVPKFGNMLGTYKLGGDAHDVANSVAMAKMRAASMFTQTRLFVSIGAKSFHVDTWQKTGAPGWVTEGGTFALASVDSFAMGGVATAPPNTQTTIAQAPPCTDNAGVAITGTACVMFNSRGLPVDGTGAPTGIDAFYLTDGTTTYGITISATGMLRVWRSPARSTPTWALQ